MQQASVPNATESLAYAEMPTGVASATMDSTELKKEDPVAKVAKVAKKRGKAFSDEVKATSNKQQQQMPNTEAEKLAARLLKANAIFEDSKHDRLHYRG
jgi:Tfp pilus assembly major pilin PilA